jgi:Na+/melibiose symporter-like transporter
VFLSIAIVFIGSDWAIFDIETITNATEVGLRSLMVIFPAVFLLMGIIAMRGFPIDKERYDNLTMEARRLHSEKKGKVIST